jgi:2-dehydro-3-deoxyphosphogluconate aldolase/(4S)-4-hydroxy-2-oxoglutarate aldolase
MAAVAAYFDEAFAGRPVMAILRGFPVARTVELAQRAWDNGITAVEVPIQTPEAVEALAAAVAAGAERGFGVGAGTVTTVDQVRQAADAGAVFTVAPGLDERVAAASAHAGLAHLPGVATASDVQRAVGLGLHWVKAFPASVLGAAWFGAMRGPFPRVRFVATGGMGAGNAAEFLDAGASVVAVGSALEDPEQLDRLAAVVQRRL